MLNIKISFQKIDVSKLKFLFSIKLSSRTFVIFKRQQLHWKNNKEISTLLALRVASLSLFQTTILRGSFMDNTFFHSPRELRKHRANQYSAQSPNYHLGEPIDKPDKLCITTIPPPLSSTKLAVLEHIQAMSSQP